MQKWLLAEAFWSLLLLARRVVVLGCSLAWGLAFPRFTDLIRACSGGGVLAWALWRCHRGDAAVREGVTNLGVPRGHLSHGAVRVSPQTGHPGDPRDDGQQLAQTCGA